MPPKKKSRRRTRRVGEAPPTSLTSTTVDLSSLSDDAKYEALISQMEAGCGSLAEFELPESEPESKVVLLSESELLDQSTKIVRQLCHAAFRHPGAIQGLCRTMQCMTAVHTNAMRNKLITSCDADI